MDEIDRVFPREMDAFLRKPGRNPDGGLMVIEETIDHRFTIGIGENGLSENFRRVQSRCRSQTDFHGVEMFQHAAILRDIVVLVAKAQIAVRHFPIEQIASMAFVDDHQVVLVDWRFFSGALCVEHPADQTLNRTNVDASVFVRLYVFKAFQPENVRKGLAADHFRCRELVFGLSS